MASRLNFFPLKWIETKTSTQTIPNTTITIPAIYILVGTLEGYHQHYSIPTVVYKHLQVGKKKNKTNKTKYISKEYDKVIFLHICVDDILETK